MCLRGEMPKRTVFFFPLSRGTVHATSECQTEVRQNTVSKYHFSIKKPLPKTRYFWITFRYIYIYIENKRST